MRKVGLGLSSHGAVYFHHRRRGLLAWQGSDGGKPRGAAAGARLFGPNPQVRSLSQRRSRHDVAVSSTARSTSPTTAPRPISTSAITSASPASPRGNRTTSPRAASTSKSSRPSGAATISARPCRSIPHVTDAIKAFALADTEDLDFVLCEIGGTVGDIESLPFIEAIRQLRNELGRGQTVLHPRHPGAFHRRRGRAEDQADPAFGARAGRARRPARRAGLPLRTAVARQRARQDRAVLQRAPRGGDPGARRHEHLYGAAAISCGGARQRSAARVRDRSRRSATARSLGRDRRAARAIPKAR